MSTHDTTRAWLEIRGSALRENLARIRASVGPDARLLPMVKADAYGLGVRSAVAALSREGPWGFGVATVPEGVELRDLGVLLPVLVLSPSIPELMPVAVRAGLELTISDPGSLGALASAAEEVGAEAAFHLEVDTGMGRSGFDWRRAGAVGEEVRRHGAALRWAGCFTHLHSADENAESVAEQWGRFSSALQALRPPEGTLTHVLNSAGSMRCAGYAADLVRPGIFLYGGRVGEGLPEPAPVAALRARVVHLRSATAGDTLGYGATYVASGPERWATVSVGYADGLPRGLSNRGHALLRGRRVPIIGRISMDVTVVNISDVPEAVVGDVVTFIGSDGELSITLDEVAESLSTISYEVLTGISRRVPRVWTERSDES